MISNNVNYIKLEMKLAGIQHSPIMFDTKLLRVYTKINNHLGNSKKEFKIILIAKIEDASFFESFF